MMYRGLGLAPVIAPFVPAFDYDSYAEDYDEDDVGPIGEVGLTLVEGGPIPTWFRIVEGVLGVGVLYLSARAIKRNRHVFVGVVGTVFGIGFLGDALKGRVS